MCFILESFVVHSTFFHGISESLIIFILFALLALFLLTLKFIGWIKTDLLSKQIFVYFFLLSFSFDKKMNTEKKDKHTHWISKHDRERRHTFIQNECEKWAGF